MGMTSAQLPKLGLQLPLIAADVFFYLSAFHSASSTLHEG